MRHPDHPEVDPAYGGEDQHRSRDHSVDPAYGGAASVHHHHRGEPSVDPAYGGDQSIGYVERADELDDETDPTGSEDRPGTPTDDAG